MSRADPRWYGQPGGPYGAGGGWAPPPGGPPYGYGYGGGYGAGADGQGPGPGPGGQRIDLLDVIEGVIKDGLSLSNVTRIARASGSNFWIGAAIGAGLVVLAHRHDVRSTVSGIFGRAAKPASTGATPPGGPGQAAAE